MTLYADAFTRADTASGLGSIPSGPAWQILSGAWRIASNRALCTTSDDLSPIAVVSAGSGDCDVSLSTTNAGGDALLVRVASASSWVRAVSNRYLNGNWNVTLQRSTGGTVTTLGATLQTGTQPTSLRVLAVGSSVQVFVSGSGTAALSVTDSTNSTVGRHGIGRAPSEVALSTTSLDNFTFDSFNSPPNAPTLLAPTSSSATLNKDAGNRFSWSPSDPDVGDSQSAYDLRYRLVGAGSWTTVSASTPNAYRDFPAGTFVVGDYEWQVRTYDAVVEVGPYSSSAFFSTGVAPAGPAITDPINGQTIADASYVLVWSSADQEEYEASVLDADGAVVFTTGTVSGPEAAATRSLLLPFPDNSASRTIRLRTRTAGLWSPYASITVLVSYTTPAVAGASVEAIDTVGLGGTDALRVDIANPSPSGGQPAVASHRIFLRCSASNPTADRQLTFSEVGTRVAVDHPAGQAFIYYAPASGVSYEVRVESVAANGTTSTSPWISDAVDLVPGTPGTPGDEGDYADANYSPVFYA